MFICQTAMTDRFSNTISSVCSELRASQYGFVITLLEKSAVALFTCNFALVGAAIGAITGSIKGHTTETGLLRGFGVGAVAGAITGVQLLDLVASGEPLPKVALISSLLNGKIFMEWMSPAVLKADQWQVSATETSLRDIPDIFYVNMIRGLIPESIHELPVFVLATPTTFSEASCAICLQDMKDGDTAKLLPSCNHFFHLQCIGEWLRQQATCPICRKEV